MDTTLAQKAINLALSGNWNEALSINQEILSKFPDDIDSLNRLARCYAALGNKNKAIETTNKVLKIDSTNSIAQRSLLKWKVIEPGKIYKTSTPKSEDFLEESGKTKIVNLLNPGKTDVTANLNPGDEAKIVSYTHKVSITDNQGKYLGCLPDDLAAKIKNFIKKGNKYQAFVKSVNLENVSILIKEIENMTGVTSFPQEKIDYVSFTPPELVHHDIPETSNTEESPE